MGSANRFGQVQYLNPEGLIVNPVFTNVVVMTGNVKTIYVGGQDAVDGPSGAIVGKDDLGAQTEQVLKNLQVALAAGGAGLERVVKCNIYVVHGQDPRPALGAFGRVWGNRPNPPTITVLYVASLANPDFLMQIDAIAVVPE